MTNRTGQPALPPYAADASPPVRSGPDDTWSVRGAGITAGVGLLLMAALAGVGNFVAVEGLVTPGDAGRTAQDVMASEGLFRLGIASLLAVVALDVVVACALFVVFRRVNVGISMLQAAFRLVYAAVFAVAVGELLGAVRLLGDGAQAAAFTPDQVHTQALTRINAFTDMWDAGLVLFGLHLLTLAYLAYRSPFVPKVLAVLIGVAGFGYVFDSFNAVLLDGSTDISTVTFVGEFLLALWLVIRSRAVLPGPSGSPETHVGAAR